MNEKRTHLDDLFDQARREAAPEFTREQVTAIAKHGDSLQSRSLLNRKGFTIMTSLFTITAASLIGYFTLSPSATVPVNEQANGTLSAPIAHAVQTTTPEPTHKMLTVTPVNTMPSTPPTPVRPVAPTVAPTPPVPPVAPIVPIAPKQIKAVDPIVVTEHDYAKLGLRSELKGLTFYMGENKKSCTKHTIPDEGWGVIVDEDATPQEPDVVLNPVLVTDSRGNKRLINFSDSEWSYLMRRSSDPNHESFEERITSTNGGENINIRGRRSVEDDDSVSMTDIRGLGEFGSKGLLDSLNAAMRAEIEHISGESRGIRSDSTLKPMMRLHIFVRDSQRVSHLDNADSNVEVKILRGLKLSDTVTKGGNGQKRFKFMIRHETNLSTDSTSTTVPHLMHALQIDNVGRSIEERLSTRLNSLVPVLVRPSTNVRHNAQDNRDYDNGVVMWFVPSAALADELPAAERMRVHYDIAPTASVTTNAVSNGNGAISNAMLFPNPATTMTSVHFQLAEPRTVAFSIHDILGKKLIDGGQTLFSAGDQVRELHLDGLSEGMYLLAMTTDKGEQVIQRIVVRK
jgi:hypothetical protein